MNLAILQARTSSTRLPGKVLKELQGRPMILHQIDRVKRIASIDALVLATSIDPSDDALAALCGEHGIDCYRGSLNDVLDRFYQAAAPRQPKHVTRLTGDCPLIDPGVCEQVISFYHQGGYDYATNAVQPTYPDGLDIEIFRFGCIEAAHRNAQLPSEREHVTPWVRKQPEYKIGHFKGPQDWSDLRWTVDEPKDFELVKTIYDYLYPSKPDFEFEDILAYLDTRPELKTLNTDHQRNEGLKKSESLDPATKQA
jgi:spore coat polysaccharide biosynthesis protein SpsF